MLICIECIFKPDGCAYVSSGLRVGHVIVGLNGYSMKGLPHREAALFLASTFKDKSNSQMDLLVVEPLNDQWECRFVFFLLKLTKEQNFFFSF